MSWADPGLPLWALILIQLNVTHGIGLLVSVAIERWGLPRGWSVQGAPRKPGTLRRHLPLIGLNHLMLMALGGGAFALVGGTFFPFSRPELLPSLLCLAIIVLADDFGFYWLHRTLHVQKELYKRIHKLHHKAYAPVPIEYFYAHPIEWMTGSLPPVLAIIGLVLVNGTLNGWVVLAWVLLRQLHELDIHSGTRSVVGQLIPFWGQTVHHDLHHARPNAGNYASTLTLWDKVFGTVIHSPAGPGGACVPPAEESA